VPELPKQIFVYDGEWRPMTGNDTKELVCIMYSQIMSLYDAWAVSHSYDLSRNNGLSEKYDKLFLKIIDEFQHENNAFVKRLMVDMYGVLEFYSESKL